jgi:hypothetical protein
LLNTNTAKTTLLTADSFCPQFYSHPLAVVDTLGQRVAYWTWSETHQTVRLMFWQSGAVPVVVEEQPEQAVEGRVKELYFGASHLLYGIPGLNNRFIVKVFNISTGLRSTLSTEVFVGAEPLFDPTGQSLLLTETNDDDDSILTLYHLASGSSSVIDSGKQWEVKPSPRGQFVASQSQCVFEEADVRCRLRLFDWNSQQVFEAPDADVSKIVGFAADDTALAYIAGGKLQIWNLSAGTIDQIPGANTCWAATTPSSSRVVYVTDCNQGSKGMEGELRVVDLQEPGLPKTLGHRVSPGDNMLVMSRDGNRVAAVRESIPWTYVDLWTLSTGKKESTNMTNGVLYTRFSNDGSKFIYAKSTATPGLCAPYYVCGYLSLRGYDFTRTTLKDQHIEGSMLAMLDLEGMLGNWQTRPADKSLLQSPDGQRMTYSTTNGSATLGSTFVLQSNTLQNRKVLGNWRPILITDQYLLVTSMKGSGVYRVSL